MAIRIEQVDAGSEAEALGLAPGDELLSVDDNELNDTLDYDFYTDSSSFHLKARVADGIRAAAAGGRPRAGWKLSAEAHQKRGGICEDDKRQGETALCIIRLWIVGQPENVVG